MMSRLRERVAGLLARLRRPRRADPPTPPLRGKARNVIVVKPRDPRFQEAIFVLRDDYFSDPDRNREELLRQAREAAQTETGNVLPAGPRLPLWPAVLLILGAVLILKLTGVM